MRIRRLQLRDVRRYRDLDIDLAPGLTVVRGPNEAGKSTIQRAIELALTRRVTSAAGRPRRAPAVGRGRRGAAVDRASSSSRTTRTAADDRHPREDVRRPRRARSSSTYDGQTITDPTLADQVLAELTGIPTEAFFRSTASVRHHELSDLARDEARPARPAPGVDQRRRPGHEPRQEEARAGAPRPDDQGRQEPRPAQGRRGRPSPRRRRPSSRASRRSPSSSATATRCPAPASAGPRPRRRSPSGAACSRRPARPSGSSPSASAAQERYERYPPGRRGRRPSSTSWPQTHPSPNPLPVIRQAVERLRALDMRIRELSAALAGEVEVQFEVAPEPTWRPLSRWASRSSSSACVVAGGAFVARSARRSSTSGPAPELWSARSSPASASSWPLVALLAAPQRPRCRASCATSRSTGGCAAAPRWRPSSARPRRTPSSSSARSGWPTWPRRRTCSPREEAHVAPDRRSWPRSSTGSSARSRARRCRRCATRPRSRSSRRRSALEALGPIAKEPRARERLEVEVRDQEAALERARDDEANARARVEANAVDAEQVAGQAERLAGWREQLAALQRRQRVLRRDPRARSSAPSRRR